jgi:hypothetical protein
MNVENRGSRRRGAESVEDSRASTDNFRLPLTSEQAEDVNLNDGGAMLRKLDARDSLQEQHRYTGPGHRTAVTSQVPRRSNERMSRRLEVGVSGWTESMPEKTIGNRGCAAVSRSFTTDASIPCVHRQKIVARHDTDSPAVPRCRDRQAHPLFPPWCRTQSCMALTRYGTSQGSLLERLVPLSNWFSA